MLSELDLNVVAYCNPVYGVQDFLALNGGEVSRLSASESISSWHAAPPVVHAVQLIWRKAILPGFAIYGTPRHGRGASSSAGEASVLVEQEDVGPFCLTYQHPM